MHPQKANPVFPPQGQCQPQPHTFSFEPGVVGKPAGLHSLSESTQAKVLSSPSWIQVWIPDGIFFVPLFICRTLGISLNPYLSSFRSTDLEKNQSKQTLPFPLLRCTACIGVRPQLKIFNFLSEILVMLPTYGNLGISFQQWCRVPAWKDRSVNLTVTHCLANVLLRKFVFQYQRQSNHLFYQVLQVLLCGIRAHHELAIY